MPVPAYRAAVFAAQPGLWSAWTAAIHALPSISAQEARAYQEIFAAEGGWREDRQSGAASGLLPATIEALVAAGRLPGVAPATPPRRLSLCQRAAAYRAYFDDVLRSIGGHPAFPSIASPLAAAALADTLFRHGGRGGTRLVQRAVVAVAPAACAVDGRMGPKVFALFCRLVADAGGCVTLLERLADARLAATGGGERPRFDHFRFRPADAGRPPAEIAALDRLERSRRG
ncbi:MAG: hypothetical protein U1E66_10495 [Rhodospirillales bacterium]